jgi:DNA-binding NarL/FixJ family response regulator
VEVLHHLADGNRNRDIAEKLFTSEETVKGDMRNILGELDANYRAQALAIALRRGVIQV